MLKAEKGITLVALVITIIVLLILAAVSISMIGGQEGIFTKSRESVDKYKEAQNVENHTLNEYYEYMNVYTNGL